MREHIFLPENGNKQMYIDFCVWADFNVIINFLRLIYN